MTGSQLQLGKDGIPVRGCADTPSQWTCAACAAASAAPDASMPGSTCRAQHVRLSWTSSDRSSRGRPAFLERHAFTLLLVALALCLIGVAPMRIPQPWTDKPECQRVIDPEWPMAYSKYSSQAVEPQGRVNLNLQDERHMCDYQGVRSKCHICEQIECASTQNATCDYQFQGVNTSAMSVNVPTVSDTPWAVGGTHRNDFGGSSTSHVCMMLSGGHCVEPYNVDYSNCSVRCWGYGLSGSHAQSAPPPEPPGYTAGQDNDPLFDHSLWQYKPTNVWEYPKNLTSSWSSASAPTFLPQGYVFTLAGGSGASGYRDGTGSAALFNSPQDLAVDSNYNVYVADTGNHVIRMVTPAGVVTTVAGTGKAGWQDGLASAATFSSPAGITLYDDAVDGLVLLVADTNNHRIRRITGPMDGTGTVTCYAGRCGNGTSSWTLSLSAATPEPGFADGEGDVARFDSPGGLVADDDGTLYVADTNNHLVRVVLANQTVFTVAGTLEPAELETTSDGEGSAPLEGCEPPCLQGVAGHRDGNLSYAQFYYPSDVALGLNNTLLVVELHDVRMISLPTAPSTVQSIEDLGVVVTLAGAEDEGEFDGEGQEARLNAPHGITMTPDGTVYTSDSASCRLRRISPVDLVAPTVTCSSTLAEVLRPSGCGSYDPPVDARDKTVTPVFGNVYYNYGYRNVSSSEEGTEVVGRAVKQCVGSPPVDWLDKEFLLVTGGNLVIDNNATDIKQDTGDGTTIKLRCPPGCSSSAAIARGTTYYSDDSAVCVAALHAGAVTDANGGIVIATLERATLALDITNKAGSTANGVTTGDIPYEWPRVFEVEAYPQSAVEVQTISGYPAASLTEGCGSGGDGQPPQEVYYSNPMGVDLYRWSNLSDTVYLYVADSGNHAVRAVSAVCSFLCENAGRCVGPDTCACAAGWGGVDCSVPQCTTACGNREVCVGPGLCDCIPGYSGTACATPLCAQSCENGGSCSGPDTCDCAYGWFGTNCTVPVCSQTCGNGGNCTAPDTCSCPSEWTSSDCRIPVCQQTCSNGGWCVSPDTCQCPPQWTGYDCSLPVCRQGFFVPGFNTTAHDPAYLSTWLEYVPCDVAQWCNATNGFDCSQPNRTMTSAGALWGPSHRNVTGRKDLPPRCMMSELGVGVVTKYSYLTGGEVNDTTPFMRYSYPQSYPPISDPRHPWSAYNSSTENHTQPWSWAYDRQVAMVELQNVTQGRYVCANGGNCTSPDVCQCAPGWIGFDCRTPVCTQGYYSTSQTTMVSGTETSTEVTNFLAFMGNNSHRLTWPYSNPAFTLELESVTNDSAVLRYNQSYGGARYLGRPTWSGSTATQTYQGGYRCSVRAYTAWESPTTIFSHPNYWSRYMDATTQGDGVAYTWWSGMDWPPTHAKSQQLRSTDGYGNTFIYTDNGHRLLGIWSATGQAWALGTCIMEFNRTCPLDPGKEYDMESGLYGVLVQDTDLSHRPRSTYDEHAEAPGGRWSELGGECVDEVVRGCYNNGTCVAPDTCRCALGWSGYDCSVPVCAQVCQHHGNCTLPDTCTCEKGWTGYDCSVPLCAQDCNNGGTCVAPDVCECNQWATIFVDGRENPRPLFRKPNGDAQNTGWTGYDCSVPICVQAEQFLLNVATSADTGYVNLGGHGYDGSLDCGTVRCPEYDKTYTANDGASFQTGCGYDPLDTGCCYYSSGSWVCKYCTTPVTTANTYTCSAQSSKLYTVKSDIAAMFLNGSKEVILCGEDHSPVPYYREPAASRDTNLYSSYNGNSNSTSSRFLCGRLAWTQGDFIDDAGLGNATSMGTDWGLEAGRHVRVNHPNYIKVSDNNWTQGAVVRGEGVYACYNKGSCIAPDTCTCEDGWTGYDCNTPLCRHLQIGNTVSSCQNGGICADKDDCRCVQTDSVLWQVYDGATRALTGWAGTDCSMPVCAQGYFDPACTDLPQAPGLEGCYRCYNGGNCTAPDFCECAEGWTGYDCRTPICEVVADWLTRDNLDTVDEEKVVAFEADPCGMTELYTPVLFEGTYFTRGNCTAPNQCTCTCWEQYNIDTCVDKAKQCEGPWQDSLVKYRDVLPVTFIFGTRKCADGYEGIMDDLDHYTTCHLNIFRPTWVQKHSVGLIVGSSLFGFFGSIIYFFVRRRLRKKFLQAKLERRRSRRNSEIDQLVRTPPKASKK